MARPQNGLNGNIQPQFGYGPGQFNVNQSTPRNHNPNGYGYQDLSQVVSGHYLSQGYPNSLGHNMINNVRPMSPIVNQSQYYLSYPSQQAQFNQFSYPVSYMPQYNVYQTEMPPVTTPVNRPPKTRTHQPLNVVDPSNNTDIDLTVYQNQISSKKTKGLLDISVPDKNEQFVEEIQEDRMNESMVESNVFEEIKGIVTEENICKTIDDTVEDSRIDQISKESLIDVNEAHEKLEAIEHEISVEITDVVTKIEIDEESKKKEDEDFDGAKIEPEYTVAVKNDDLLLPKENNIATYNPPINKKESDETTLRKKLIYDRGYLITIKSNSQSQRKPRNFPSTSIFSEEIIYNESQNISCKRPESSTSNDKFGKKQAPRNPPMNSRKIRQFQPKMINLDHNENQILTRLKSSYLPPQLRDKEKEMDAYHELKRNIKCNLNKITPQNFQDCLSEIGKLNIKENDEMSCLISEIFIKAVQEEAYSVTYAQFCNKLAGMYSENQSFKGQLLKKCQDMFQTPIQEQLDTVRKEWVLKIDSESDLKMKGLYESDLEEQVKRAKDRYFGNIRFIGELFLHHLLAGKVIQNCIVELLKGKTDNDALLALCKLMETCGKQIDERNKDMMDAFIKDMYDLSKSSELETRIRFRLKDIVDMRHRKWTLRHIQQEKKINPKTIEEQKEEAAAEAALKLLASHTSNKKSHHNTQNNSVRRQMSSQPRTIAVKNLTFEPHFVDEKTVLGPVKSMWAAGSGSKPKPQEPDIWTPIPSQKFAVNTRSPDCSPQVKIKNKYRTLESSTDGSGADSRSSTPPINHPKNGAKYYANQDVVLPCMTDDERAQIMFIALMSTGDFDIESWLQIRDTKPIIEKWIDDMMEKDSGCRHSVGDFFCKLVIDGILTSEQLVDGLQIFVTCIPDLICDIPKLWEFFAQFMERFIRDKNSNIGFFLDIFKDLIPNINVACCLSMSLHAASSRLGHNIVGQVFRKSSLDWSLIVPNNWENFVKEKELDFTISGGAPLSSFGGHSLQSITEDLQNMLLNESSNESVFLFLEKHIDKPTWKSSECTRTITSCIIESMKSKPIPIARVFLKDKSEIIKRLSHNKVDNEIEVLRSVLNVADKLDKEILMVIYDVIMIEKVVSDAAFEHYLSDVSFKLMPNFDLTHGIIWQLYKPDTCR